MRVHSEPVIPAEVLLRAISILAVVFNHAHANGDAPFGYGGGMTFLMLLSGLNFARFSLQRGSAREVRHGLVSLGLRILVPCLAIVLASFALKREFDWAELLFVSDWFTPLHVSLLITWYPQVLLQILLILYLLFSVEGFARAILTRPLASSVALLVVALLVRATFPMLWDTSPLKHRLPHLFLWNFVLGWVVFFSLRKPQAGSRRGAWLAIACTAVSAFVGWPADRPQPYWLIAATSILVFVPRVRLPGVVVWRAVSIVGQATFAIFLLHPSLLRAYRALSPWPAPEIAWLFAVTGCVALWLLWTSLTRAYRTVSRPQAVSWAGSPSSSLS